MATNVPLLPEEKIKNVAQQQPSQAQQGAAMAAQIAQGVQQAVLAQGHGEDNIYTADKDLKKDLTGGQTKGNGSGGGSLGGDESSSASTPTYDRSVSSVFGPTADAELVAKYNALMQSLDEVQSQKPVYDSRYDEQIQSLYEQIMGRGSFKYDSATDPLFQNYKAGYIRQGKDAMRDTMGQAAALTGGYGSSYAQSVGQQAYGRYLEKLAEVLPETYGMALDAWNAEGNRLNQNLATTTGLEQSDYSRYLDKLSQHNLEVSSLQQQADTAYERARAQEQENYNRQVDEYNRQKDAYNRLLTLIENGYAPTKEEYAAAGLSQAQGEALRGAYAPEPEVQYVRVKDNDSKAVQKTVASATKSAKAVSTAVNNIMKFLK